MSVRSVKFESGRHCCAGYLNLVWVVKVAMKNVM